MNSKRRRGVDFVELGLILLLVAGAVAGALSYARRTVPPREILPRLADRYGSIVASLGYEEWFVRDYFKDSRGGVFVDVGSGPAKAGSNTYVLETQLGWSGVAIDAQADYGPDYPTMRPRTRFVAAYLSDREGASAELWLIPHRPEGSSRDASFASHQAGWGRAPVRRTFTTTTLESVLRTHGIDGVDYLNVDVELSEPQVLAGFDIDRHRPRLVSIEAHVPTRQAILDYFGRHGYVVVGKYLRDDPLNLWFRPLTP